MKLYAIVTSERASKGQGGNTAIVIEVKDRNQELIAYLKIYPDHSAKMLHKLTQFEPERVDEMRIEDHTFYLPKVFNTKGKQQKGDRGVGHTWPPQE